VSALPPKLFVQAMAAFPTQPPKSCHSAPHPISAVEALGQKSWKLPIETSKKRIMPIHHTAVFGECAAALRASTQHPNKIGKGVHRDFWEAMWADERAGSSGGEHFRVDGEVAEWYFLHLQNRF